MPRRHVFSCTHWSAQASRGAQRTSSPLIQGRTHRVCSSGRSRFPLEHVSSHRDSARRSSHADRIVGWHAWHASARREAACSHVLGATRIHLDTVDELGTFVELETLVGTESDVVAATEHDRIFTALDLDRWRPISGSYSDLLPAPLAEQFAAPLHARHLDR